MLCNAILMFLVKCDFPIILKKLYYFHALKFNGGHLVVIIKCNFFVVIVRHYCYPHVFLYWASFPLSTDFIWLDYTMWRPGLVMAITSFIVKFLAYSFHGRSVLFKVEFFSPSHFILQKWNENKSLVLWDPKGSSW